ncbi:MAG TPA: sugar ABC transporter permease [Candidatus Pullichristensenella excrementigallinarum]|uniref:Sugar ABC transporter permease n=1 Tax=Candidatus Pullichristensenella excrementigallinarum TaxID=2840907 RepID=A0A9D1IBJ4_9FIRM|nr:sugar ABC transporter permease [Candidatus Pullichristensenella excrementigallinarum]
MQKTLRKYFPMFVLPTLIAFVIAFLIPFLMGIYLSFTEFTTVTNAKWVGWKNFDILFFGGKHIEGVTSGQLLLYGKVSGEFLNALWFTVKFTVVSVLTVNVFAFALALLLTKNARGTNLYRTVFFMPNLIGGIVLGVLWQLLFNGILSHWGKTLVSDARFGFWGLVILMNWQMIGYMMIIYIAGIQSIPGELYDAADVDGASGWKRLTHVTLPMVMPSVTICTFLTLTNSFKLFDQNLALTAGAPSKKTAMLALDIYETFYDRSGFEGIAQAKAVLFFLLVALIAFVQLYLTRRKEVDR